MSKKEKVGPLIEELRWCIQQFKAPKLRNMRNFAIDEIVIPNGPFEGRRFKLDRQPYTKLWFDAVDSGRWNRFVALGPSQSGKTLAGYKIPLMFHLFEMGETTICGVPDMEMASDKWREDILPAIERSRFREWIPKRGSGSRGGRIVDSITFDNGATLKFMSGGGSDKSRAGFTARVLVVTETDGMDEPGGGSREADKITQLEARTRAYGNRKRVYLECTVSVERGRTWREYQAGTASRIVLPCPACGVYVSPEREHLVGWQQAENAVDAQEAYFACPVCGEAWSEQDRRGANLAARLIHTGQEIGPDGSITGDLPKTDTLGFRWSAVNNLFVSSADLGKDEWRAARSADEDNAEKEMLQFVWAKPYCPPALDSAPLEPQTLVRRLSGFSRGIIPPGTEHLTMGLDLGKWLGYWTLIAWRDGATGSVVDYGVIEVKSDQLDVDKALMAALREFREIVLAGWPDSDTEKQRIPNQVWIDSGWKPKVVYPFCRESREGKYERFRPAVGRGETQQRTQRYSRPKTTGSVVRFVGEEFHISKLKEDRIFLVEVNADYWKTWTHERFGTPLGTPGAMSLFDALPNDHLSFAKHLTAEKQVEEFIARRGTIIRWEKIRQNNHWLDAQYNAAAAGHFCGARLLGQKKKRSAPKKQPDTKAGRSGFVAPDGRPFLVTER